MMGEELGGEGRRGKGYMMRVGGKEGRMEGRKEGGKNEDKREGREEDEGGWLGEGIEERGVTMETKC